MVSIGRSTGEPNREGATAEARGRTDGAVDQVAAGPGADAGSAPADTGACPWIDHVGPFRQVTGFDQAATLLNDERLHADLVGLFEGIGLRDGPVWEALRSSFLSMNGPEHRRLRGLVASHFTPRAVSRARPAATAHAHRLAGDLARAGDAEFVADFATPYVASSTCGHIGFPLEDVETITRSIELVSYGTKDLGNRLGPCTEGVEGLLAYGRAALALRRDQPADDVLTSLVGSVDRGDFPETAALSLVAGLLSAGHEPTVNQLAITIVVLADHPDQWDAIASGDLAVARAVEEVLRFRSTNQGPNRLVTEPVELDGQRFRTGEQLLIGIAAANRDPSRFPNPDVLDPEVNVGSHLAFGLGVHFCLGAALARLQLQEAVTALVAAMACPTVTEVVEEPSSGLTGPTLVRLRCTPR